MPRYYHGGRDAVDPTKYFPESLQIDDNDAEAKALVEEEKKRIRAEVAKAHPLTSPSTRDSQVGKNDRSLVFIDGKLKLKRPLMFCKNVQILDDGLGNKKVNIIQEYDDWIPGSIVLALPQIQYAIIPPGGHIDVDFSISEKLVKSYAPHLLTEAEYAEQQKRLADKQQTQQHVNPKTKNVGQAAPQG